MQDGEPASVESIVAATDSGWDVDAQVLTLQQEAATTSKGPNSSPQTNVSPVLTRASKGPPPLPKKVPSRIPSPGGGSVGSRTPPAPVARSLETLQPEGLVDLLRARVAALEGSNDRVGLARTHVELALVVSTLIGDPGRARTHAEAALRVNPTASSAHALVRALLRSKSSASSMLEPLEHELALASTDTQRVKLLVEKARLLEAVGGRPREARSSWERALALDPTHAAALKGLEAELVAAAFSRGAAADWAALAEHFGRMSDTYQEQPSLAAWLLVERARILERKLDDADGARAALERAVELDPEVGPVRDALVRHLGIHGDWPALVQRLDEQAAIDSSNARAARFELEAATIAASRLGDKARTATLLDRAAARSPTVASVDRRVLDELVRLSEDEGRWADAARARRARLRFVSDPSVMAYELRALATAAERQGDIETGIADLQRALAIEATDPALVDSLDRLLRGAGKHEQRIAAWLQEAARTENATRRAEALMRAAHISEQIGRVGDAIRHLRSAWVAAPANSEVLDGLARLLAPRLPEMVDTGARALVELYAGAAQQSDDDGRKVAYLERVALLWEELLGDSGRAARTYEEVLALDPDRRSAIIGLARTAARLGEAKTLARALLDEARVTPDKGGRLALRTRAAVVLSNIDPVRAAALVRDVLHEDDKHREARALETRLFEESGRWELAARSIRARADHAETLPDKVALWLALAHIQHARLHVPLEALASLDRARALDPAHPVPPEEIARVLEDYGEARALRDAVERLAASARTREERARQLGRAAEIDELRLSDDATAARTYQRALAETPEDDLLAERLARVTARKLRGRPVGELAELSTLLTKRLERASTPSAGREMVFDLAFLLVDSNQEPSRASSLLESLLAEQPDHPPALRTLEWLRRLGSVEVGPLARVLAREAEAFTDVRARLGALWALAALQEWALPAADLAPTYRAILALDPLDVSALEATLRLGMTDARQGDSEARSRVLGALRGLIPSASNDEARQSLLLSLAMLLETAAAESATPHAESGLWREALNLYRDALRIDDLSVTAATGLARTAARLRDAEASLAAVTVLAEVAPEPRARARHLVEAADILLGPEEGAGLGERSERRARAVGVLERALTADPESMPAGSRLTTLLTEERQGERLVSTFRTALGRAREPEAIVMLGSEIARVARDDLRDLPVAIDAMRRVRGAAPEHVPSLLTLAELCIAQRVWPEAVDALESVVAVGREISPKLTALFALASIYEKVLARPAEVDRVLRAALSIEPKNVRALRALVRRMSAEATEPDGEGEGARARDMASLLERLAETEPDADEKTGILLELSEVRIRLGELRAAERALVEAVAASPDNPRAFGRLANLFKSGQKLDAVGYARALTALITLGEKLGRFDARWWATRGQISLDVLGHSKDGAADLLKATELDPTLYETRVTLAAAYAKSGDHGQAADVLLRMITPTPHPLVSVADPPGVLELLDDSLTSSGRGEDAVVVDELRSLAGTLDEGRRAWLSSRRVAPLAPPVTVLDRATLVRDVLPIEGRHALLDVAAAIAGVEAKILRSDLGELGISSRDRTRAGHPTRALLDRLLRQLGVTDAELVVTPKATRLRVLVQDVPWILVPPTLVARPKPVQLASLARAVVRIAYGVPWMGELPSARVESLLVAAARLVSPGFGLREGRDLGRETTPSGDSAALSRALSRRQRKLLEDLGPKLMHRESWPPPMTDWADALTRAELRAAFILTGELLAVVAECALDDAALQSALETPGQRRLTAVLNHPLVGDTARFALSPVATELRTRMGTGWTS